MKENLIPHYSEDDKGLYNQPFYELSGFKFRPLDIVDLRPEVVNTAMLQRRAYLRADVKTLYPEYNRRSNMFGRRNP